MNPRTKRLQSNRRPTGEDSSLPLLQYTAANPEAGAHKTPTGSPETRKEIMPEAQPTPPPRAMMLADLNVDPPESDGEDDPPTPKPNPAIAAAVAVAAAVPVVAGDSSTRYVYEVDIRSDSAGLLLLVHP